MAKPSLPQWDFDPAFQRRLLRALYQSPTVARDVIEYLDPAQFDLEPLTWAFTQLREGFRSMGVVPSRLVLEHELRKAIKWGTVPKADRPAYEKLIRSLEKPVGDRNYILQEAHEFIRYALHRAVTLENATDLRDGKPDWQVIQERLRRCLSVGEHFGDCMAQDLLEGAKGRAERRKDALRHGIPTGTPLDHIFKGGGLPPRSLGVVVAPPGVGKTAMLSYFAASGFRAGKKGLYITLEMPEDSIFERIEASLTGIPLSELGKKEKRIQKELRSLARRTGGEIRVKEFASGGLTVGQLRAFIKRLEATGYYPDYIIIDYADLMDLTEFGKKRADNDYAVLGRLYVALRGLSFDLNVPIWTASQANRTAITKANDNQEIGMDSVADSLKKAAVCDFMVAISQSKKDAIKKVAKLAVLKNRFGRSGTSLTIHFDVARVRVEAI